MQLRTVPHPFQLLRRISFGPPLLLTNLYVQIDLPHNPNTRLVLTTTRDPHTVVKFLRVTPGPITPLTTHPNTIQR